MSTDRTRRSEDGVDLIVRGEQVLLGGALAPADLVITGGTVAAVVPIGTASGRPVLEAEGRVVLPGAVDAHVHANEPGRTHWVGFASLTAAAAAGGVTTVVDMPIDSNPPTVTVAALRAKRAALRRAGAHTDVALWGGLVPGHLDELDRLLDAGAVGFKAFLCDSGWADFPATDAATLRAGCTVAAARDVPVVVHAETDEDRGSVHSEVRAVRWAAQVAAAAGARLHVAHVSAAAAVGEAARWPHVTVETCPHCLALDDADVAAIGPKPAALTAGRDGANRRRLLELLHAGHITTIASDHSPCPPAAEAGGRAVVGHRRGAVDVAGAAGRRRAHRDAEPPGHRGRRAAGAGRQGAIAEGFDADLALVDPVASYVLTAGELRQRNPTLSPYVGRRLVGRVHTTLLRGRGLRSCRLGRCHRAVRGRARRPLTRRLKIGASLRSPHGAHRKQLRNRNLLERVLPTHLPVGMTRWAS
ncbi:MAG: amidohydrolase family protein [Acidimicrobiales bacterium]